MSNSIGIAPGGSHHAGAIGRVNEAAARPPLRGAQVSAERLMRARRGAAETVRAFVVRMGGSQADYEALLSIDGREPA